MGIMEEYRSIEIIISYHSYSGITEQVDIRTNHILFPTIVLPADFVNYCYIICEGDFSFLYIQDIKNIINQLKVIFETIKEVYCEKEKQIYSIADWWYCDSNKRVSPNEIVQRLDPHTIFYIDNLNEYNEISKGVPRPDVRFHYSYQVNVSRDRILKSFVPEKNRNEMCRIFMILILFKDEFEDLEYFL